MSEPVQVTLYVTPNTLPSNLVEVSQIVEKVLTDIQMESGGKFAYTVVDPDNPTSPVTRQELWDRYRMQPIAAFLFSDQSYYLHLLLQVGEEAQVLYLGLIPDFKGRGFGRFLLSEAVFAAFAHAPGKIIIETNTLDSAHALVLYQKAGFRAVGQSQAEIDAWD